MSLTSKTDPYKAGFGPFVSDVYRIPYAYCYRCSYSLQYPSCELSCAHHLEDTFKRIVAADSVAAIVVEPIMGEGGFIVPPIEFLPLLGEICHRHGILLIADEVQTGFGRTGRWFACERYGIEPDLLVTAKSLGGGLPIGAVTGRSEVMDAPVVGSLGGTFAGNPLSCESALAALEVIESQRLLDRAEVLGQRFASRAQAWQSRWPLVGDVRGLGAMQAIELVRSSKTREPAAEQTRLIVRFCYEHGLILLPAGTFSNVIRLLVPLVITDEQFEEGLDVMQAALESVCVHEGQEEKKLFTG